jgi:hypothetical protein
VFIISNERKTWLIPDMYWPEITSEGHYVSHESISVLNDNDTDCELNITLFFEDREPMFFKDICPAFRTKHIRIDKVTFDDGTKVPRGIPYSSKVECSLQVAVQYTRVDTTQSKNAIMTTLACQIN